MKYSFERMPKSDWGWHWPTLDRVDVKDKYSGVTVPKSPYIPLWLLGIGSESGTILPKVAVEKLPRQRFTTELPAHCGPYVFTEWIPKQKLILRANANFPGTKPAFPEVHIVNVEDNKAAEIAYEAGELDTTETTPETAARYARSLPAGSKLMHRGGPFYTWMGMNTEHEKLRDIRVRKAIQRAVDVESIIQASYEGASPKAFGVVPVGIIGQRTAAKYSYNPDEARALLEAAGVSDLTVDLVILNEEPNMTTAQVIQSNLAEVGITAEIKPTDSGPFWNLGLESAGDAWKTLQLWIMRYRASPDPSYAIQWFVKSQIGVWNWERWWDPEFEKLWIKGLTERDVARRAAIYVRMQEIMEDTGAYVWITHEPLVFIHKDDIVPEFGARGESLVERYRKA